MDPNKKTLSSKSNNSPWLLCPSKSFPGKFYYFNGSTGETAWSLSDSDPNHPKKDVHRVEDNSHVYPEPFGPPDDSTNTSSSSLKKDFPSIPTFQNPTNFSNRLNFSNPNTKKPAKLSNQTNFSNRTSYTFGSNLNGARTFATFKSPHYPMPAPTWEQSVFPTYLEDRLVPPKIVWTLTPMLLNEQLYQMFEPTQYDSPDMFIRHPTMQTFQTFNRPHGNPFFKHTSAAKGVQAGSPIFPTKIRHEKDMQTEQEPQTREEACQTFGSEVDVPIEPRKLSKPVLKPSKFGAKITSTSVGISTSTVKEVENDVKIDKTNKSLGDNDLRFILEAKRRKSVDNSEAQKSIKDIPKESTPKKRVTFNLEEKEELQVMPRNDRDPISAICSPLGPKQDILYVVPDSEILIRNYDYIEKIVLSADNCRLLVPFAVKAAVYAAGRDECWDTRGSVPARYVLRKLMAYNVIIQRKPEKSILSEEDSILDCCWQFSQDGCSLTLLTSNKVLIRKAENIGISCSLFDPLTQQIVPIINDNKDCNKLNEESENPLEVDIDISKLDIYDECRNKTPPQANVFKKHDKEAKTCIVNAKNDVKVSGITKLNSVFDIDEEIARYYIKNEVMEHRLTSRSDEWVSRLILTMEGTLFDVLLKENVKKNMPPKDLQELIRKIGDTFKKHVKIRTVVDNLLSHLQRNVPKISKIKPVDYIKLLGFCMILVQNLKEILDYTELDDADDILSELIKHIEDPSTDIELRLDKLSPPRSDIAYENKIPLGYRKKQSNVLEYLKTHFPETFPSNEDTVKVVRTVGKDLNAVKVYNTKAIVDNTNFKTEPVIVKKFKVIEAFEDKLKKHEDPLDYEELLTSLLSDHTSVLNDNFENENTRNNNKFNSSEDVTDDLSSELEKECIYAFPLLKAFLAELRVTFLMIYNLVSNTMQDSRGPESESSDQDFKINMAYNYIVEIAEKLKSIMDRESGSGPTLKTLLIRAGEYVEEDRTMSQYKELIAKYLKQAKILETALELILTIRSHCPQESSNFDSSCMS